MDINDFLIKHEMGLYYGDAQEAYTPIHGRRPARRYKLLRKTSPKKCGYKCNCCSNVDESAHQFIFYSYYQPGDKEPSIEKTLSNIYMCILIADYEDALDYAYNQVIDIRKVQILDIRKGYEIWKKEKEECEKFFTGNEKADLRYIRPNRH